MTTRNITELKEPGLALENCQK